MLCTYCYWSIALPRTFSGWKLEMRVSICMYIFMLNIYKYFPYISIYEKYEFMTLFIVAMQINLVSTILNIITISWANMDIFVVISLCCCFHFIFLWALTLTLGLSSRQTPSCFFEFSAPCRLLHTLPQGGHLSYLKQMMMSSLISCSYGDTPLT